MHNFSLCLCGELFLRDEIPFYSEYPPPLR